LKQVFPEQQKGKAERAGQAARGTAKVTEGLGTPGQGEGEGR